MIERTHFPRTASASPKFRMHASRALKELPGLNEAQKLRIRNRTSIYLKTLNRCGERVAFVIKTKACMIVTQRERRSGHGDSTGCRHRTRRTRPVRLRPTQRLRAPRQRLKMHRLVKQRQSKRVQRRVVLRRNVKRRQHIGVRRIHVLERCGAIKLRQIPSRIVRQHIRIQNRIRVVAH